MPGSTAPFFGSAQTPHPYVLSASLTWYWDVGGLTWEKGTQPAGGGGGAVTIANGADVALGATTDAAVITDTTGTVSGKLRGLVKWAFERMPTSLGQKAMAASLPVVVASDQSAVPVSAASLPLPTGAATEATVATLLTDAQLRASAVPVSGPLTDAQLRAVAVPISAASLPLPTGAATSALQTQPGVDIGDVTVNNAAGASAVNIQDGGNSITVDGTVAVSSMPTTFTIAVETYAILVDEATATITYVGRALPGSATSSAVWAIKRLDSTSGLAVLWADGNVSFDNIWDNRAALSYS